MKTLNDELTSYESTEFLTSIFELNYRKQYILPAMLVPSKIKPAMDECLIWFNSYYHAEKTQQMYLLANKIQDELLLECDTLLVNRDVTIASSSPIMQSSSSTCLKNNSETNINQPDVLSCFVFWRN